MLDDDRRWLVAGLLVTLLLFGGYGVYAAATSYDASERVTYGTSTGLEVTLGSDRQVESGNPFTDTDGDNDADGLVLDNSTFSAEGSSTLTVESTGSDFTNVTGVDVSTNPATINRTLEDNATVTLDGTITAANVTQFDIADDTTDLITTAADDTATITVDTGGVGVVAVDRNSGTAFDEAAPAPGEDTVTIDVPDGTTEIDLQPGPQRFFLREATDAQQPVNKSIQFRAEFFQRDDDSVFTKNITDANTSLAGLPKTESFVAYVQDDTDEYVSRRTLIESIFEQNTLYLLNENKAAVNVTFRIEDRTGEFGRQSTLQVQRPLNISGTGPDEKVYRSVAGDTVGQKEEFTTTLQDGVRYRLILSSRDGDERQLGTVLAERDRVYNLVVTGITSDTTDTADGGVINTTQAISGQGGNKTKTVEFIYQDPSNETTKLEATVHEAGNPSNQFDQFSASPGSLPLGTFKYKTTFNGTAANTTLVGNYTIVRGTETRTGVRAFGADRYPIDIPLSGAWQQIFGVGMLIVVAGLFSVGNARIGALIIPTLAFVLFVTGIMSAAISLASVGMAFTVAVAINVVKTTDEARLQ